MSDETILAGIREILEEMDVRPVDPHEESAAGRVPPVRGPHLARDPHLSRDPHLTRDLHLARDLDLDSLKRIELVIRIENEFRVRLEPEDEGAITTLGDLVDVIRRRRA